MISHTQPIRSTPFGQISDYVLSLRKLAAGSSNEIEWSDHCNAALNGEANKQIRLAIPISIRRKFGAFFTGTDLRKRLVSNVLLSDSSSVYYDPTCGMGDLLLAVATSLPLRETLTETLKCWGRQLAGTDLHSEFIEGAKSRLIILARQRHRAFSESIASDFEFFPNISIGDALKPENEYHRATHVLMNPPFGSVRVENEYTWTNGTITAAAVFVVDALNKVRPGVQILAVLPEVLRSGSFSEHWRQAVNKLACVSLVEPYGLFDEAADVDVFILGLMRKADDDLVKKTWPSLVQSGCITLGENFHVHVGKVVPYRDQDEGISFPYIHPRCVPPWTVMTEFTESRRHKFPGYLPPFVVIRRTSSPSQPYRATAAVISGDVPVAVENHLLVCQPKDGRLDTCLNLMEKLKSEAVNSYLNKRIRCRHLTVSSVSDIPIL